jgi:acetyl-CoA acyltransferase
MTSSSIQTAYIVAAQRLPVGRKGGVLAQARPDDMLAHAIRAALTAMPEVDHAQIGDVIVGCAMPEAEQGMNVARIGLLLAGLPKEVPGMTINRFCASGLQAVALAAQKIQLGEADLMIAAGTESMSAMPQIMGNKIAMNPRVFAEDAQRGIAFGMGLTAEKVATQWSVSRDDQDAFALASHQKACAAQAAGHFAHEMRPLEVSHHQPDLAKLEIRVRHQTVDRDEGPRADTSLEKLGKLKSVFHAKGSVTAGNSSQMSDGAAALVLASEAAVKRYGLNPLARFVSFEVAGVPPEVMGIGPIAAIPKALSRAGLKTQDVDWIELNEAFAAQALAVMRELKLDPAKVNPLGGAIAWGHPLGATGAIRAATAIHGLRRTQGRYGLVSMCIGTGMGAAGVFERL